MSPNVPGAPRGKAQNKRPACALSAIFWRVGPSTRGATAPQRAQQVNFVGRRANWVAAGFGMFSNLALHYVTSEASFPWNRRSAESRATAGEPATCPKGGF